MMQTANKVVSFTMLAIIAQAMLLVAYLTNNAQDTISHTITKPGIYIIVVDSKGGQQMYTTSKISNIEQNVSMKRH